MKSALLRSERRFLRERVVSQVVDTLTGAESVTIYCGAGVSINRTGLTWSGLIKRLASYFYAEHERNRLAPPRHEEVEHLLDALGPQATATIMHGMHVDIAGRDWLDLQRKIGARLAQDLYSGNSWEEGRLARNIIDLAQALALRGKRVSILTTNYDTFLEERWGDDQRILSERAPKLVIYTLDVAGNYPLLEVQEKERLPGGRDDVSVELTYLHGRVSPSASLSNSALVISEYDYAKYRSSIEDYLKNRFETDHALLIVGSSLSDTPLVDTLIRTAPLARNRPLKVETEGGIEDVMIAKEVWSRICLMPAESFSFSNQYDIDHQRYIRYLQARAQTLGVSLYIADFKFQIAQLVEEATLSLFAQDEGVDYRPIRYGCRLTSWWDQWSSSEFAQAPGKLQEELSGLLNIALEFVDEQGERHESGEQFKLELWVREGPASRRELVLWATSQAALIDRSFLNSQEIERSSKISSVMALTEGRVIHKDISEIRGENPGGIVRRWNSYLSVPIYIRSELNSRLPVGVLTIASSAPAKKSILPPRNERRTNLLLHLLIKTAREWLKTPDEPQKD